MKRALVVGSEIEGLKGVTSDTRRMKEMLASRGFAVDLRTGHRATRAGILEGYDALIAASGEGDAAVFYYSGHGFYGSVTGMGSDVIGSWQCIAPTDIRQGDAHDWRGITAWELSIKQGQLTAKTKNVTVILDCCRASQMSRDAAVKHAVARALPHPVKYGFAEHLQALRDTYKVAFDAVDPLGNPDAVRLVACGQTESAYESPDADGESRGAFTDALLTMLEEVGEAQVSWAAIGDALRARVLRRFPHQRPDIEGPARRRLFSLTQVDDHGHVAVRADGEGIVLQAGVLTGVTRGDVYGVMPIGAQHYDAKRALGQIEVIEPLALAAKAKQIKGRAPLPKEAVAMPLTKQCVKRAVALEVPERARQQVEAAIEAARTLRVATIGADADVPIAKLKLVGDVLTIEDEGGPVFPAARFPDELAGMVKNVANLGVAQGLRELEGEHGVFTDEVRVELGAVHDGREVPLPDSGAAVGLRDRIYVKVATKAQRRLYVHVFNVGVRGKVTLLSNSAPSGVALDSGDPAFVLGRGANGVLQGIRLHWPKGMTKDTFPRVDEYLVIVTTAKIGLQSLETRDFLPSERGKGSALEGLLAQLQDGLTRDAGDEGELDGFYVKRLSFVLHPREGAMTGMAFEIDEQAAGRGAESEPSAWLTRGAEGVTRSQASGDAAAARSLGAAATPGVPRAIAIRLADLVVEKNRALWSSDIRVDALICTRSLSGGQTTWTQKFTGIRDGERLALDNGLLFHGPVVDFVDLTLFVSRDTEGSVALAKLFAERATSPEFKDAAGALLIAAGAVAVPWVAAVGASAVLSRMAYELVLGVAGRSIGLYRTSFLAHEQFGVGRHPHEGLYRAQDFSFSLLVEPVELADSARRDGAGARLRGARV
jgi:Caspase domain